VTTVAETTVPLWPVAMYFALVVLAVVGILLLSWLLGERHRARARDLPYESGIEPTGNARLRLSADFYLVAMFFVIFDLESVFIFAWAVAMRPLGIVGYIEVLVFIGVLLAALAYLWRSGALDWGSTRRRKMSRSAREANRAK
jgi:NADH-quinone oxidoreductase subunit A